MKEKFKIVNSAIGYDSKSLEGHVIVPIPRPTEVKGRWNVLNEPHMVTSNFQFWPLSQQEQRDKGTYVQNLPNYPIGKEYWSEDDIKSFIESKGLPKIDPYVDVFEPICNLLEQSIDFHNSTDSLLLTSWIMGTYLQPIFDAYPYIFLSGTRGSGKTKVLEIVSRLAFNAEMTSNSTPSAVFRVIQANSSTLLIDEGEMLSSREDSPEMRLILNAGYKRNNPVSRTNKDTHQVEWFNVFSPKMIAAINPLDQTLKSRCLQIVMVRTSNKEKGNIRINDTTVSWQSIKDSLYRYGLQCMSEVKAIVDRDKDVNSLQCRQNELWSPLLAVAKHLNLYVSSTVFDSLLTRALFQDQEEEGLDDWHKAILYVLGDIVTISRDYPIREIKLRLTKYIEDQKELERMTSRWIGAALARFGLTRGQRDENGNTYRISKEEVVDLMKRYQMANINEHPEHTVDETGEGDI